MKLLTFISAIIILIIGSLIGWGLKTIHINNSNQIVSFSNQIKQATPYVVNIYTYINKQHLQNLHKQPEPSFTNLGSGILIHDGYILTNKHLIMNTDEIIVVLNNQVRIRAKLIGSDTTTDLAVLKIPEKNAPDTAIDTSNNINVGDITLAIGSPYGLEQSVTMGIISALARNNIGLNNYENFIQTDAAINPGNSGGALINSNGELIGINTAIFSNTGGSHGIGFAIPIHDALYVMQEIIKHGKVTRGYLGIKTTEFTHEVAKSLELPIHRGLLISMVDNMSPAQEAGIKVGDIIAKINNKEIWTEEMAKSIISKLPINSDINIIGIRGNQSYQANIKVEPLEEMGRSSQYY
ncbi:S1C family serine protease [Marinomonas algicola]|uniref:S1C family serine protease n=1 Tax=Marinomonas algicola TaxID=2773454 RepID=UPI00174D2E68|nr:trypsin-like peptidase domain-containing protein [Marinomonas algicola]